MNNAISAKEENKFFCVLCKEEIPEKTKPEHVLLNALGGRMTVRKIICPDCNHSMGIGPDNDLADSVSFLRNACDLKAGDGDSAPHLQGYKTDEGDNLTLEPGMQPNMRAEKALDIEIDDENIKVSIQAYSDEEADRLAEGAARKIAKHRGHSNEANVISAIKKEILKDKQGSFRPSPQISGQLQFGQGSSIQSMAKSCLILWARINPINDMISDHYNLFRDYIKSSEEYESVGTIVKIDTRSLPTIPTEYSENPNIIWVGNDSVGNTYGYFRIYGAIGWRFLISEKKIDTPKIACLISNPFDNRVWSLFRDAESPITYEWVTAEWELDSLEYSLVQEKISKMMEYSIDVSQNKNLTRLVHDGLKKSGCEEGEIIERDHIKVLSSYVSRALVAQMLKIEVPDDL